jgi:hypothetical protein
MWFWCNSLLGVFWLIFPIMFLVCLFMMLFCMRRFFGRHFGDHFRCCSPCGDGWKASSQDIEPRPGTEARGTGSRREEG